MNNWQKALEVLKKGGIVIFPTDTAFGIGCRIDNEISVERLFEIRKRPKNQATPILVSSIDMAKRYVQETISEKAYNLMKKYWPGALTLVLPANLQTVPALVRGGGTTVGLRIPDETSLIGMIEKLGVPILGPSANFHGGETPYKFEQLSKELIEKVDFVVRGKTKQLNTSTVLDVTKEKWKILRQGAVSINI
ncbi:MAG: hypothetical protein ACD_37C00549G0003 [uncultured bacterium]|nr:MAG: hypothetical protein ACD_37C00549G0003 [uncultured bacterium]